MGIIDTRTGPSVVKGVNGARLPQVIPWGDSITDGVGGAGGFRAPLYQLGQANGTPFFFNGTLTDNPGPLAGIDPNHEGLSFYCVQAGAAQSPPFSFNSITDTMTTVVPGAFASQVDLLLGGTNDLAASVLNCSAATVLNSLSIWLDLSWSQRKWEWKQIILSEILKRLDADDSKVQTVNAGLAAMVAGKSYAANVQIARIYGCIADPTVGGGYSDAVHPNLTGYGNIATAYNPYVRTALSFAI